MINQIYIRRAALLYLFFIKQPIHIYCDHQISHSCTPIEFLKVSGTHSYYLNSWKSFYSWWEYFTLDEHRFLKKTFGCRNVTMHIMSQKVIGMMPLKSEKSIVARYWFLLSWLRCEMRIYPKWNGIINIPFSLMAQPKNYLTSC